MAGIQPILVLYPPFYSEYKLVSSNQPKTDKKTFEPK